MAKTSLIYLQRVCKHNIFKLRRVRCFLFTKYRFNRAYTHKYRKYYFIFAFVPFSCVTLKVVKLFNFAGGPYKIKSLISPRPPRSRVNGFPVRLLFHDSLEIKFTASPLPLPHDSVRRGSSCPLPSEDNIKRSVFRKVFSENFRARQKMRVKFIFFFVCL